MGISNFLPSNRDEKHFRMIYIPQDEAGISASDSVFYQSDIENLTEEVSDIIEASCQKLTILPQTYRARNENKIAQSGLIEVGVSDNGDCLAVFFIERDELEEDEKIRAAQQIDELAKTAFDNIGKLYGANSLRFWCGTHTRGIYEGNIQHC